MVRVVSAVVKMLQVQKMNTTCISKEILVKFHAGSMPIAHEDLLI